MKDLLNRFVNAKLGRQLEQWVARQSQIGEAAFFPADTFPWARTLEANWQTIRAELDSVLEEADALPNFQDIMPRQYRLSPDNRWKTYYFYAFGFTARANCQRCPQTWQLLQQIPGLQTAFFSILAPGKHIPEHRGKHKGLIRYHLGLKIPEPATACRIRVDGRVAYWQEGESLIFDDTYLHEAWNEASDYRVVLFLDIARPLHWPLSWVNWTLNRALAFSPIVRTAKANHQHWEQEFARRSG